eukprot:1173127-Pyramimonas_sp.AAC.1
MTDGSGFSPGDRAHTDLFHRKCGSWVEFFQESDTRREIRDNIISQTSRLDRIYSDIPSALLADLTISTSVVGRLKNIQSSDHIPVLS